MKSLAVEFKSVIEKNLPEGIVIKTMEEITQCGNIEHTALTFREEEEYVFLEKFSWIQDSLDSKVPVGAKGFELKCIELFNVMLRKDEIQWFAEVSGFLGKLAAYEAAGLAPSEVERLKTAISLIKGVVDSI